MRNFLLPVCLSLTLMQPLFAVDPNRAAKAKAAESPAPAAQTAPADAKNKPPEEPQPIVLKNKSSFQLDAGARSPFWPIGWKPAAHVATGGTDQGDVPPGAFLVTSITLDGATHFAIINGKTMSEGQQFGLQLGTQIYQVSVKRIEDGKVILGRRDQEIVVPLRRK